MIDFNNAASQSEQVAQPDDAEFSFAQRMAEFDLIPKALVLDGELHRFDVEKRGDKAGWYIYHQGDGISTGAFGNWKTSLSEKWCSRTVSTLSPKEQRAYQEWQKQIKASREREQQRNHDWARQEALRIWNTAQPAVNHPYLQRKNIQPHYTRIASDGRLIVPEIDIHGDIWALQYIAADGSKRFQYLARRTGLFFEIQGIGKVVYLCEGFSTGATINEATGATVICAFNAGSLLGVARVIQERFTGCTFVVAADNDQFTAGENVGVEKASKAAAILSAPVAIPEFSDISSKPTDFNDMAALEGLPAVKEALERAAKQKLFPIDILKGFEVMDDYVEHIGNEEWIFKNLIIKNQITVIVAKSGSGKTAISFDFLAEWIVKNLEMTVYYLDLDSPASDHKRMYNKAQEIGKKFKWINPLTHGKNADDIVHILEEIIRFNQRLDDVIFWFDTMKKFVDMLDKKSVKPFYVLLRQLTALGATVVLLGHANKHRDTAGHLVFEGVGDVVSDSDALLFFERITEPDGGNHITTVCDSDRGAKVRGLYEPITFHLAKDRTVTLCDKVVDVPEFGNENKRKFADAEEAYEMIVDFLKYNGGEPATQQEIIDALRDEKRVGRKRLYNVLVSRAELEQDARVGQLCVITGNKNNRKYYTLKK